MKLSRLFQPRRPLFWLLVILNVLSSTISFILRGYELSLVATWLLSSFAFLNFIVGLRIALRLMRE